MIYKELYSDSIHHIAALMGLEINTKFSLQFGESMLEIESNSALNGIKQDIFASKLRNKLDSINHQPSNSAALPKGVYAYLLNPQILLALPKKIPS